MHISDGQFHTGTELAGCLDISRAAVWKHVQTLRKSGLSIEATPGKGYRLQYPIELLNSDIISSHLDEVTRGIPLQILWQTASTNDWLKQRVNEGLAEGTVCLAEQQTAGRGTKGRQWFSPPGVNLYLSMYWSLNRAPSELGGLSLAVAVSIVDALVQQKYSGLMIKWPNDIITSRGKLGGILIDMVAETNGPTRIVIGIGLNVGMKDAHRLSVNRPIDDLDWQQDRGSNISRNKLAACIINNLSHCCRKFQDAGFKGFYQNWRQWDVLRDREVEFHMETMTIKGTARGVDESGALLLESEGGVSRYSSGEVSLKVMQ